MNQRPFLKVKNWYYDVYRLFLRVLSSVLLVENTNNGIKIRKPQNSVSNKTFGVVSMGLFKVFTHHEVVNTCQYCVGFSSHKTQN